MRAVQILRRRDAHQLRLDFRRRLAVGQAGAVGDAEDVGVDRDRAFAEHFHQHHVGGLAPDARQRFQRFALARHFAVVLIDQRLAESAMTFLALLRQSPIVLMCSATPASPSFSIFAGVSAI